MKKLVLIWFLVSTINGLNAQNWCDSTLTVCDSVFVESVLFTHSETNGDRVHVAIVSNHDWLYAPSFVLCASNEEIVFVDNEQSYFGLFGSMSILAYYEFENFDVVGDSLIGNIVVNNTNNGFENCIVPFKISVPTISTDLENKLNNTIEVFPNPASDFVTVRTNGAGQTIQEVYLVDNLGNRHQMTVDSDGINLSEFSPGMYLMHVKMSDEKMIVKRMIIL